MSVKDDRIQRHTVSAQSGGHAVATICHGSDVGGVAGRIMGFPAGFAPPRRTALLPFTVVRRAVWRPPRHASPRSPAGHVDVDHDTGLGAEGDATHVDDGGHNLPAVLNPFGPQPVCQRLRDPGRGGTGRRRAGCRDPPRRGSRRSRRGRSGPRAQAGTAKATSATAASAGVTRPVPCSRGRGIFVGGPRAERRLSRRPSRKAWRAGPRRRFPWSARWHGGRRPGARG